MRAFWLCLLCFLAIAAPEAGAQQPVITYPAPWGQVGSTVPLSVSNVTGRAALGWVGVVEATAAPPSVRVCNTGTVLAYVKLGDSSAAATTSDFPVLPGTCSLLAVRVGSTVATYVAAITAASTTSITAQSGNGDPYAAGPGLNKQTFAFQDPQAQYAANTTYYVCSDGNGALITSEAACHYIISVSGTFDRLIARVNAAPGAGQSVTGTLRVGNTSSTMADTTLTCQIADTQVANTCTGLADIAAGQLANIKMVTSAGANAANFGFSLELLIN